MEYFERIWSVVPPGVQPEAFGMRREFLLGAVAPGQRVLDLGCGEALFASALIDAGAQPVAADVAREPLRRAAQRDPRLELVELDGVTLPFAERSFDMVWAGELLEHVQDVVGLLDEVARVLRPGAPLVLSTPDHPLLLRLRVAIVPGAFAHHFDPRSDHVRFFTAASLRALLEGAGFARIELARRHGHLLGLGRARCGP